MEEGEWSWNELYKPNNKGGLGFQDLESFNLALLCKRGWRIVKNSFSLLARVMQAKYFPLMIFHQLLWATVLPMSGEAFLLPDRIFYKELDGGLAMVAQSISGKISGSLPPTFF